MADDDENPLERAKEAVGRTREAVSEKFQSARAKLAEGADQARHAARQRYGEARERLDRGVEQIRDRYEHVSSEVEDWVDEATDYIRRNPAQSVLIAAGAGFLLGFLLRRRD